MKKMIYLFIAIFAIVFTSCNNHDENEELVNNTGGSSKITVSIEDFGSRTTMSGNRVFWANGDEIMLFDSNGNKYRGVLPNDFREGNVAEFTVTPSLEGKTIKAALYPYCETAAYESGVISTTIVNNYSWVERANNKAPMATEVTNVGEISFKNAGSLISLTVNNIPAGYNEIILSSDICLAGSANITFTDGVPQSQITSEEDGNKKITINFDASVIETNKVFYFPISVADYSTHKLDIVMSDGTNSQTLLDDQAITSAARNKRYYKTINFDANGNMPTQLSAGTDIDENIATGETSFILDNSTNNLTIGSEINEGLDIAVTTNENTFILTGEKVSGQVNLSTPSTTTELEITLPKATVEIKPDAGVATYSKIIASTAENTLIIPAGVTVEELIVKKGNVKVYGTLNQIYNQSSGYIKLYYGNGAIIPANLDKTIEPIDIESKLGVDQAKYIFANGGELTLQQDLHLGNEPLILNDASKKVIVNLNGHTITGGIFTENSGNIEEGVTDSYVFWVKAGTLVINGYGNVVAQDATYSMAVWALGNQSKVTINGGNYYNGGDGCDLIYAKNGAQITITGGEFKATRNSGNESATNNEHSALNLSDNSGASIVVTGGKFYKFNPALNVSENPEKDFVAPGYSSVQDGDWYIVSEGVNNEEALVKAVGVNYPKITLSGHIQLTSPLVVAGTINLDLNGHSITPKNTTMTKVLNTADALILVRRTGKLTIQDSANDKGSIDTGNNPTIMGAIKMTDSNDGNDDAGGKPELFINGGTIRGYHYGIMGNGNRHGTYIQFNKGVIKAGWCNEDNTGIFHPQAGTLEINGGAITGYNSAVELRSGTLNIISGSLTSTCLEGNFSEVANGNGVTIKGAAVAISQHTTDKPITVNISGEYTKFTGLYALYEKDLQNNSGTKQIVITGGTFKGAVYSQNCTNFISGGRLGNSSAFKYLANDANVSLEANLNLTNPIVVSNTSTIDLNGFNVTANNCDAFEVQQGGQLTINDCTGKSVVTAGGSPSVCAVWANGGNVNINGGNFKVSPDNDGNRNDCIYVGKTDTAERGGSVVINGGTFEYTGPSSDVNAKNGDLFLLNCADTNDNAHITVNGGMFKNHVPSFEPTGTNEVSLGEDKSVYIEKTETKVNAAHTGESKWYEVR